MKADAHSLKAHEHTADILGSGEGQRALCKDDQQIRCQSEAHDDESVEDSLHVPEGLPSWKSLQAISFQSWASSLCREVLKTRTSFAAFLKSTLSVHRSAEVGSEKALFPLPVPRVGVFEISKNAGSKQRQRRAFQQAFHVIVMALNFWHADFRFIPARELAKTPSPAQLRCLDNMRRMLRAYGGCKDFVSVPCSGRRSTSLTAQLADLCDFLTWQGTANDAYHGGFAGADGGFGEVSLRPDTSRDEALVPYRSLDPSRLKLSGTGEWDPGPFLSDSLWMAYHEPASLVFRDSPEDAEVPDLTKETYADVLALAKVWDVNGLLRLEADDRIFDATSMRFFNCYKSIDKDRMIGDRRARNAVEGSIPGASRSLPPALLLSAIEIRPESERLSICISDRKDFYHQFKVSPQRSITNMCFPPLRASDLEGTFALASWVSERSGKRRSKYDRTKHGDFLAGKKPQTASEESDPLLRACFASIPQGDSLGVEFAVDSHRSLLRSRGLLCEEAEMRADRTFRGSKDFCGLVIDDFYAISVVEANAEDDGAASKSWAVEQMQKAQQIYKEERLRGSEEKDVYDAATAKVTGAELDSSQATRALGLATLASPWQKRISLSFLSLQLAKLPVTTDSLHLCLIGGWVHSLLYRRPMMSILSKSFHLVSASEVSQEQPKVIKLPRSVAQELVLLAILSPLMATDLSAELSPKVYATDSSDLKGAIVQTQAKPSIARALWRSSKRRGGYVRMMTREEALVRKLDFFDEPSNEDDMQCQQRPAIQKPLALRFHFIEVCGGSGKVSKFVADKGWVVGPVLDLDRSPYYDLQSLQVLSWIYHLLEEGLLDSFMVEPPCTTFSPAQHPASRSYECPRGFQPTEEKTLQGTTLALRALSLMWKASQVEAPGLLEQPRKSKMKKLSEWRYLIEAGLAEEFATASCMFGSIHQKEFVFLLCFLEGERISRKCSRDHEHIPIEGKWTKPSATYVDGLALALADLFHRALTKKLRADKHLNDKKGGLENPLCNDVLLSHEWKTLAVWRWKIPRHINIQETTVVEALLKRLAVSSPKTRQVIALDSNVGLCALVKGRSSSLGLRATLRRIGATTVVGSLYPGYHFAPTRWNPADHPTRDNEMPKPLTSGVSSEASLAQLLEFARGENLRRPFANWVRLFTLLCSAPYGWYSQQESWRFMHHKAKHFPFWFSVRHAAFDFSALDFDSTLGFPGEGPLRFSPFWTFFVFCLRISSLDFSVSFGFPHWTFSVFPGFASACSFRHFTSTAHLDFVRLPFIHQPTVCSGFPWPWTLRFVPFACSVGCGGAVSHGPQLHPRDAGDKRRASTRGDLELPEGRPVLGQTQKQRDRLLVGFEEWLKEEGFSLQELLFVAEPDIETLNIQLERFGRSLFRAGRPYNHYAETINALSGKRPRIRRSLQQAWDLAYAWLRSEPPTHHLALPWQVLLSLLSTAFFWGWPLVAGIIALSWGGLTRIGEALSALRSQLVLPQDVENTADFILLQINEPKTRFRAARHQVARVDQPQLVKVIELAFRDLHPNQKIWPFSGQTMRSRFQKLLEANKLSPLPQSFSRGLDLGSLRAGGASWLLMRSEDAELTRRRGRWINNKVMEVYVQEVSSLQFLPNLPKSTKRLIISGVEVFPWVLSKADDLRLAGIPEMVWPILLNGDAVATELDGWKHAGKEMGGKDTLLTNRSCHFRHIAYSIEVPEADLSQVVSSDDVSDSLGFDDDRPALPLLVSLQNLFYRLQTSEVPVSCRELMRSFGWDTADAFMQHDAQELNRLLCDRLEEQMKGTPTDGEIKRLFEGEFENYIECVDVDYRSQRNETFYDLQLNVKDESGAEITSLEDSLKDFVREEILEGDNAYDAESHGKQRARKGIRFKRFPPVLYIQLKRFMFDIEKMDMNKLNSKMEFPLILDLEALPGFCLAFSKGSGKYMLHTVIVHSGGVSSGHYYTFVRLPQEGEGKSQWIKFDDEVVTFCSEQAAVEDNYGGEDLSIVNYFQQPQALLVENWPSGQRIHNAYMLSYVRIDDKDLLTPPVLSLEDPKYKALIERCTREAKLAEERRRERVQRMNRIEVRLTFERDLMKMKGFWPVDDVPGSQTMKIDREESGEVLLREAMDMEPLREQPVMGGPILLRFLRGRP
eukprot:s2642_g8.t1